MRAPNGAPERPSEAPKTIPTLTIPAARRARNHAPERPSDDTKTSPWQTFPAARAQSKQEKELQKNIQVQYLVLNAGKGKLCNT